jgi:hypothetical protein
MPRTREGISGARTTKRIGQILIDYSETLNMLL